MIDAFFEKYPLFRYIPAILLMACIFRSSAVPGDGMGWLVSPFDKFMHAGTYAVLGAGFCLWFRNARWESRPVAYAALCVLFCVLFGALDEFHQSFVPGRSAGFDDVIADFAGGVIGTAAFALVKPWRRFRIFRER